MIRIVYLAICAGLFTLILGIAAILASLFDPSGNLAHIVARIWGRWLLWAARIKVQVKGFSRLDPASPYIYMPNHLSNFDIPVLLASLKVQFRWLAKVELFKIPFFGFAMKRVGYISIDRTNRRSAFMSLKKTAETLRNGTSVMIFPEGTRSPDGNLSPFKKGGFVLAVESGIPIVPIVINGTWEIMSKDGLRVNPGTVTLEIRAPIETKDYTRKTKEDLMLRVRDAISAPPEPSREGPL